MIWYVEEKLLESMNCNAAPMWRLLCDLKNVQVLEAEKKSAWTDLDRVIFEKNFKESLFKSKNRRGLV